MRVDAAPQNQGMPRWKANRDQSRGNNNAAEREASVYVRVVLELVRDARYVPSQRHAAFTRESSLSLDSAEPHSSPRAEGIADRDGS